MWGECITALYAEGMTIAGNEFRDCFSVGVYVNTSRGVRVEGNIIRAINPAYRRNGGSGKLIDAILMGSEAGDDAAPDFGAEDVVVANNIIVGTHTGVAWWDDDSNARASNTYQRVQIVSNVVWGAEQSAIMFDDAPASRTAPSATLTNNILYESSGGTALQIGDSPRGPSPPTCSPTASRRPPATRRTSPAIRCWPRRPSPRPPRRSGRRPRHPPVTRAAP